MGAGEDLAQSARRHRGVPQHGQVPVRAPDGLGQPPEGEQTEIGVGSPTDPADDDRQQLALDRGAAADPLGEGLDVAQGPVGIRVADCGKTLARRLRTQSHLIGAEGGREGQ